MNKKMAAAGLAAGLVAGAGAGLVLELSGAAGAASPSATETDDTTAPDDTTAADDTSATDDTTATDEGKPDQSARLQEVLQPLIDDGTLTQAQADAVIEALVAAGPVGHGPGGPGRHRGAALDVVAETLGITEDEVRAGLEDGQTLAQIAEANGSDANALVMAIVADIQSHLAERVADGDITQAEADEKLADATERVTEMVNSTRPDGRFGPGQSSDG